MAAHSSILAWRISWTEEPGALQSIGSQRVRQDWGDLARTYAVKQGWKVVGVDDKEKLSQPKKLPQCDFLLWRRVTCPLPHLSFLIQRNLLLAGLGPGDPIFQWKFVKVCISSGGVWESCIVLRLYRERGDVTALCSNVPSPISQYLLMPKRRTPWNWGNLGSSTLSSEAVLMRKWAASYLV